MSKNTANMTGLTFDRKIIQLQVIINFENKKMKSLNEFEYR